MKPPLHITQHKRFVPEGTHPNFCFAKTSFMLRTLYAIRLGGLTKDLKTDKIYHNKECKNGRKNRH
jgi:hypothetical protein